MNRQLTCPVSQTDTSMLLAQELVHFGFINEVSLFFFIKSNQFFGSSVKLEFCKLGGFLI